MFASHRQQVLSRNKKFNLHCLLCSWEYKWSDWKRWIRLMPGTLTLIWDGDGFCSLLKHFGTASVNSTCICKLISCQWTSRCEDANARVETNLSMMIDNRICLNCFVFWRGVVVCATLLAASMFMSWLGHSRSRNVDYLIGSDEMRLWLWCSRKVTHIPHHSDFHLPWFNGWINDTTVLPAGKRFSIATEANNYHILWKIIVGES